MATEDELLDILDRGDELKREGKVADALKAYTKVWNASKDTWDQSGSPANMAAYSIVEMYLGAGQPQAAAEWVEPLLRTRKPNNTASLISAGRVWLELGDEAKAFDNFGQAFEFGSKRAFQGRDPKYLEWYLKRAGKKAK